MYVHVPGKPLLSLFELCLRHIHEAEKQNKLVLGNFSCWSRDSLFRACETGSIGREALPQRVQNFRRWNALLAAARDAPYQRGSAPTAHADDDAANLRRPEVG